VSGVLVTGETPNILGSRHPSITPFEAFETKDGYRVIGVGNDKVWERFCSSINKDESINSDQFKTNPLRTKNKRKTNSYINTNNKGKWYSFLAQKV
jgi:CoA:oxalate CoA-transferase